MKPADHNQIADPAGADVARIVVDVAGGDAPVAERLSGALQAAELYADTHLFICGPARSLHEEIERLGGGPGNVSLVDAPQLIGMHEAPVQALREKPRSSVALGIGMVADGEADAFVSAGNTGAVTAAATLKLGRPSGLLRPGIAAPMKVIDYPVVTIDVGANVDCKPMHLLQYGIMADVFAREVLGIQDPRVGLLNIGEESTKGNELTKQAFELLNTADLQFVGNIEPEKFFHHGCDVLVCDGFAGNVLLKFAESLVLRLMEWLREQVSASLRYKLGLGMCKDLFGHLRHCADYTEYGGAPLLGVNGVTIITHGSSDARAIRNAIREAHSFVEHHVNEHIEDAIKRDAASRSDTG
ncbi:MAG: phosphate acyltransferase PlsX [Candidatus Brocadiaceae bacterium]|jgi:glycerol-3-phosphate acyltransferase PlsX